MVNFLNSLLSLPINVYSITNDLEVEEFSDESSPGPAVLAVLHVDAEEAEAGQPALLDLSHSHLHLIE